MQPTPTELTTGKILRRALAHIAADPAGFEKAALEFAAILLLLHLAAVIMLLAVGA